MVFLYDLSRLWQSFLATDSALIILLALLLWLAYLYARSAKAVRDTLARGEIVGWSQPAERKRVADGDMELIILRPTGRHYFFYLVNAGLALGLGIVVLQTLRGGNPSPAVTLWFGLFCVFVGLWFLGQAVWLLRRIEVQGNSVVLQSPIRAPKHYDLRELTALEPAPKTFRDGVRLKFQGKERLEVPARFEGYRDLLTYLAQQRPQIMGIVEAADPTHK